MYYKPDTEQFFATHSEVRNSMLNVIFPTEMDDAMLAEKHIYPLRVDKPEVAYPKIARPTKPIEVDGQWVQTWVEDDMTQEELEANKPLVPQTVTRRQARQALLLKGVLDKVDAAIASLDDGTPAGKQKMQMAQIEWQDSLNFERNRPLVVVLGGALGFNAAALDELFTFAATL